MTEEPHPLTLQECAERLHLDLKLHAPALVTLKRWSASGLLNAAKTVPDGAARVKYNYAKVLQVAHKSARGRAPPRAPSVRPETVTASRSIEMPRTEALGSTQPKPAEIDLTQLSKVIAAELTPIVAQALATAQQQMFDGLANLDATRKSLMLRYDAEVHALRETVATLKLEHKRLTAESVDVARLNVQLSRLADRIESMNTKIQGNHEPKE